MMNQKTFHETLMNEIHLTGGFTYDPSFGLMTSSVASYENFGQYLVTVEKHLVLDTDISTRQLKDMINHASSNHLLIGAWLDTETSLIHYDYVSSYAYINDAIKQEQKKEALKKNYRPE